MQVGAVERLARITAAPEHGKIHKHVAVGRPGRAGNYIELAIQTISL